MAFKTHSGQACPSWREWTALKTLKKRKVEPPGGSCPQKFVCCELNGTLLASNTTNLIFGQWLWYVSSNLWEQGSWRCWTRIVSTPANISMSDLATDNLKHQTLVQVTLKSSKMDPFCQEITFTLGDTGNELCPVRTLFDYLHMRGTPRTSISAEWWVPMTRSYFTIKWVWLESGK